MIPPKLFYEKIKNTALLISDSYMPQEKIEALYKALMHNEVSDFNAAMDIIADNDEKLTLANIKARIAQVKEERQTREYLRQSAQERKEIKNLINSKIEPCSNQCSTCDVQEYCPHIAKAIVKATLAIVAGGDKQQICHNLIQKFPNANLEQMFIESGLLNKKSTTSSCLRKK